MERDAIELALTSPMDWQKFEIVACELLMSDDLPRLRKLGGASDEGRDAVQESFFQNEQRTDTVVQITSQKAQLVKLRDTIVKLKENGISCAQLVIVFRQPVSSGVRGELLKEGVENRIAVDVRDQSYLIGQLGKPGSNIFARHFQGLDAQVKKLLKLDDPLAVAGSQLRHAMLASLGAYVINPRARLVRNTLFEKTVLAALVTAAGPIAEDSLVKSVKELVPEEAIDSQRLRVAAQHLQNAGYCHETNGQFAPTKKALAEIGRVLASTKTAYGDLLDSISRACKKSGRLDDATSGYLERNVRLALLSLLRVWGPLDEKQSRAIPSAHIPEELLQVLSANIGEKLGRIALAAMVTFSRHPENTLGLSIFARTYAALALKNLDPIGRRWQQTVLSRTLVVLDTDAVLYLIIEELPEHETILKALKALANDGVTVAVPEFVLREAVDHLSRAHRTYRKFCDTLFQMSTDMVDGNVWHAVVRGFYYAKNRGTTNNWDQYWSKYYDKEKPEPYIRHLLSRRINCVVSPCDEIPLTWHADLEAISATMLEQKEISRLKAEFRELEDMAERTRRDVKMAMHVATRSDDSAAAKARGYLVSEDRGFLRVQEHPNWAGRPQVLVFTRVIPELAEFVCGTSIHDDVVVRLLFNPAISAAASMMSVEIEELTELGVSLHDVPLDRLEWDLSNQLKGAIEAVRLVERQEGEISRERVIGAVSSLLETAQKLNYSVNSRIAEAVTQYESAVRDLGQEKIRRIEAERSIARLAEAGAGASKKGRTRVRRALKELGINLEELIKEINTPDSMDESEHGNRPQ